MALLEVLQLSKRYTTYKWFKKSYGYVLAPVSFTLEAKENLAIVGESGSGKSTLAMMLACAKTSTGGSIKLDGVFLQTTDIKTRCQLIRMIFQDPNTSLNPNLTIKQLLMQPLSFNKNNSVAQKEARVTANLLNVGLLPEHANFYPHMLSEGQKQRVSVARAIMLEPKIIIIDDTLSATDILMRTQLLNLLLKLQKKMGISYIFVTNNMSIVHKFCDSVLVLKNGVMVEKASSEQIFNDPQHEYTKKLTQRYIIN